MTKSENIEFLYNQIPNKGELLKVLSKEFNRTINTLRHHWFSKYAGFAVPELAEDRTIDIMQKLVNQENEKANGIQVTAEKL